MKRLKVGIVGFGLSGRYLQSPFFVAHPGFELRSVVTSRGAELKKAFPDAGRKDKLEDLLSDDTLDLISVCSPNATHFPFAKAALAAGKHVLIEKPACATAAELRELRTVAERQQRKIFVFHNRRWDSDFLTVRKVLRENSLGELVNYEARFDRWKPGPNPKAWKESPGPASGMLYDLGAHILDQAIALFGRPKSASGKSWIQRPSSKIDDAFDLQLDYPNHRVSLSCSLLVREPTPRYVLHGTKGSFVKYGIDVQEDQLRAGRQPTDAEFGREPKEQDGCLHTELHGQLFRGEIATQRGDWWALFENVYQSIVSGEKPAVPLDEVILQLEIMEAVAKA